MIKEIIVAKCRLNIILAGLFFLMIFSSFSQQPTHPALIPSPQQVIWLNEEFIRAGNIFIVSDVNQNIFVMSLVRRLFPNALVVAYTV